MALVACPACKRSVSSSAANCPHCGHPSPAGAALAPTVVAASPLAEQLLWEGSPSLKALLAAILGAALFAVLLPLAVFLGLDPALRGLGGLSSDLRRLLVQQDGAIRFAVAAGVATVVAVRLLGLAWRIAVLKSHHYRVSNQRLMVESGVLSRNLEELDMRTVEDSAFRQSLLERLLGVGQIAVVSSDKTAARMVMLGIERPREVRELIRGSAYQATRGQLFTRST